MRLLIIGGTVKTGRELINQGLEQGHFITALVQNPSKLNFKLPNLRVIKGDVRFPESFGNTFKRQDAVLSALWHKRFFIKTDILSKCIKNIINEMKKNN